MDAAPKATCAPSHETMSWDSLPWTRCRQNVKRLQARIVKATEEGRWGKVKALQRLLTHSFSGKVLAVNRVLAKVGKLPCRACSSTRRALIQATATTGHFVVVAKRTLLGLRRAPHPRNRLDRVSREPPGVERLRTVPLSSIGASDL